VLGRHVVHAYSNVKYIIRRLPRPISYICRSALNDGCGAHRKEFIRCEGIERRALAYADRRISRSSAKPSHGNLLSRMSQPGACHDETGVNNSLWRALNVEVVP
jgi:hypothetical protein